jgi:RimJ/RimL family protein N-acetyltransferase|tara:strand:- start:39 stop:488 length:450 start_codon:yes stop_codon:yes gene_type:complete
MIHAREKDFDVVKDIFYQHKQFFPHIRTDYMRREIAKGHIILEQDVVITYNFYKRKQKIGNVQAQQGDCILHQIAAKHRNGSASNVLQNFFKWTKRRVFLSVRSENLTAKKFYEKNGMEIVGQTSWSKDGVKNALPGDVYMYDNVEEVL